MFNEDFSSLVISGEQAWETLEGYISHVAPELVPRLSRHTGPEDVFSAYRIDEQLVKALDRKVWLPSGGTLVIDRTEAMTVVDVNTGKFTGSGGNLEETVTRNNLEAAEEVVRQLRLRDIGGMIVIDFIDMVLESNRDLVLRRLTECLGRDRTRHQVAEVTSLGLVQMTRKRVGQGLLDEFSTPCEHCKGRGVIVHTDPVTGGHEHRSGQNGSSGSSSSGSASNGSPAAASAGSSGDQSPDGADRAGSGQNGSGSGSGRRRGRGRRGASSEGGSPTTVTSSATAGVASANGVSGHVPTPAELAQRRSAAGAEDAEEPEVELEVEQAQESAGTPEVADEAGAADEAGTADEVDEAGAAEETPDPERGDAGRAGGAGRPGRRGARGRARGGAGAGERRDAGGRRRAPGAARRGPSRRPRPPSGPRSRNRRTARPTRPPPATTTGPPHRRAAVAAGPPPGPRARRSPSGATRACAGHEPPVPDPSDPAGIVVRSSAGVHGLRVR